MKRNDPLFSREVNAHAVHALTSLNFPSSPHDSSSSLPAAPVTPPPSSSDSPPLPVPSARKPSLDRLAELTFTMRGGQSPSVPQSSRLRQNHLSLLESSNEFSSSTSPKYELRHSSADEEIGGTDDEHSSPSPLPLKKPKKRKRESSQSKKRGRPRGESVERVKSKGSGSKIGAQQAHPQAQSPTEHSLLPLDFKFLRSLNDNISPDSPSAFPSIQKQVVNAMNQPKFRRWCFYEFFYSAVEQYFFLQNEFAECLVENGLGQVRGLSRREWRYVRNVMGKPRRLSRSFFDEERKKLQRYRQEVRAIQQRQVDVNDLYMIANPNDVPPRLSEGQRVTVIHPDTAELCFGTVMSYAPLQSITSSKIPTTHYRIKFDDPALKTLLIPDTDVMPHNSYYGQNRYRSDAGKVKSEPHYSDTASMNAPPFPHGEDDLYIFSNLLKLLDQKNALVDHLKEMNQLVERLKKEKRIQSAGSLNGSGVKLESTEATQIYIPQSFKQQYAWVIVQLERVSQNLEQALLHLRIRRSESLSSSKSYSSPAPHNRSGSFSATTPSPRSTHNASFLSPASQPPSPSFYGRGFSSSSPELVQSFKARAMEIVNGTFEAMKKQGEIPKTSSMETGTDISRLISSCLSLLISIEYCAENGMGGVDLSEMIDELRPKSHQNMRYFESIEDSMRSIRHILCS